MQPNNSDKTGQLIREGFLYEALILDLIFLQHVYTTPSRWNKLSAKEQEEIMVVVEKAKLYLKQIKSGKKTRIKPIVVQLHQMRERIDNLKMVIKN